MLIIGLLHLLFLPCRPNMTICSITFRQQTSLLKETVMKLGFIVYLFIYNVPKKYVYNTSPLLTFILMGKLALNYARSSRTQRPIKFDSTVFFGVREGLADRCGRAVCGCSLTGIVDSKTAGDMDVCLL